MSIHLIETNQLAENLNNPTYRIFDCSVFLNAGPNGYEIESGRAAWEKSHIAGSGFLDLVNELSDPDSALGFTMPSAERFAAAMSQHGVDESTQVVLYDRTNTIWAARVWWMLRAFGFENAAILNGGWQKWQMEDRPVDANPASYPAGNFVARTQPALIATKAEVIEAMNTGQSCILNSLKAEAHQAKRIPGSVNVPYSDLLDPETNVYLALDALKEKFADVGATSSERVIAYCGGGIGASSDAFILTLIGVENVAVYDGSMSEWTADESLPVEMG